VDKDAKEARNRRIFDLWMACWTEEEIAAECGCSRQPVKEVVDEMASLPKHPKQHQAAADHATDFEPPIYSIWKQLTRTVGI
jgi:hypothetical protein